MTRAQAMTDAMAYSKLIKAPVYLYKRGESYRSSQLEKLPGWSKMGFAIFGRERVYEDHAFERGGRG